MRASNYSNLNTSKLSTKLIEDTCSQHEGEVYTNFCTAMTCIKPLCPECIENHYNHHKNIRTVPEIDSFKTLKNKCVNKIADILEHVGAQQGQTSLNQLQNIFELSLRRVKQIRDHCRKISDSYFSNLEEFIKKKMGKITSEQSELIVEMDRVNNIVAELKMLLNKLQNTRSFLSTAEMIVKLDGDRIEEKVKEGFSNIVRFKEGHKSNLFIQKNYEQKYYNFLASNFYYGNKDNLETMPKVVDEIRSKNAADTLSRSHSRLKEFDEEAKISKVSSRNFQIDPSIVSKREDDQKSTLSRKSSKKGLKAKKEIIGMNTFSNNSPRRYLHFFQHDQNILHYLDLDEGTQFQNIRLNINFHLPDFHKSISVSTGDLYVVGGAEPDMPERKSASIYKFDFNNNSLLLINKLKYGRSSHSICFNNRYIYVLGGYLSGQILTDRCQRYDIVNNKVQEIRPMNNAACSFACCSFAGRYVYKFGGVGQNNQIIPSIERFDQKTGIWQQINPSIQLVKNEKLVALSTSAAVQITKQEIMVMGGYDERNRGYNQTYILKVEESGATLLREINVYPLPHAEGFWSSNPIIHKKMVFALQNVSMGDNDCSESLRRILSFDGASWKQL